MACNAQEQTVEVGCVATHPMVTLTIEFAGVIRAGYCSTRFTQRDGNDSCSANNIRGRIVCSMTIRTVSVSDLRAKIRGAKIRGRRFGGQPPIVCPRGLPCLDLRDECLCLQCEFDKRVWFRDLDLRNQTRKLLASITVICEPTETCAAG
jgi:uncharacterized Zn-finger protein